MWRLPVVLVVSLALCGIAEAAGFALQSHRAVYDLTLSRSRDGGGISGLSGRLAMEWSENCEGYIVNQRMLTEVTDARGQRVINDFQITSWESLDGLAFRYSAKNEINGKLVEEVKGKAALEKSGGAGGATFTKPEAHELALPRGTVFPTEQVVLLVRAAESGKRSIGILVFDGSRQDGLYDTFSVIGSERPLATEDENGGHALLHGQRSWPAQLAFFPVHPKPDQAPGTPEFEVGFRLYQNGIFTELTLDYGDFALAGTLAQLEALPKPDC
ncbi:MAG: cell envelope integrity EipB family protein [Alphaproteobacteria bacterium]|jgi:hypothetical protein|nr:cell envelope integrity EipB family protein [Alphaproteobacteria bacterium]